MDIIFNLNKDVKPEIINEVWIRRFEGTCDKDKEETSQTKLNTYEKEESSFKIQTKSEDADVDRNTGYECDSIKLELLQEEVDIKNEILSDNEDKTIRNPINKKLSLQHLSNSQPTCNSTRKQPIKPSTSKQSSKDDVGYTQFIQYEDLDEHKIIENEKRFQCTVCSYASIYKHCLKRHMKTHTGQRPYKCSVCNYASAQKGHLELHIKTHTGEKPFRCSVCDYACVQKCNLDVHMKIHNGEKPYKCKECDYASVHKCSLNRHIKTHTGEKPFQCGICSYGSVQKHQLKAHMVVHSGEKTLKCLVCDFSSVEKCRLQQHMKTHTGRSCRK